MKKVYKRIRWEIPTVFLLFSMFYSMLSAQQIRGQQLATALQQRTTQDQRSAMLETYIKNTSGTFAQQLQKLNGLVSQNSAKTANFSPQIQAAFAQKFMELYNQRNNNPTDLAVFNQFMQEALKTNFLSAQHKAALQAPSTQKADAPAITVTTNDASQTQTAPGQIPTIDPVKPITTNQEDAQVIPQEAIAQTVQLPSGAGQAQVIPTATQSMAIENTQPQNPAPQTVAAAQPAQTLPIVPNLEIASNPTAPQQSPVATITVAPTQAGTIPTAISNNINRSITPQPVAAVSHQANIQTSQAVIPTQPTNQAIVPVAVNTPANQQIFVADAKPVAITTQPAIPVESPIAIAVPQQPAKPIIIGISAEQAPIGGHAFYDPTTGIESHASTGYRYDYKNREIISPAGIRQKMSDEFYNQNRTRLGLPELPTTVAHPTITQPAAIPTPQPTIQPDINATTAPTLIAQQQQQLVPSATQVNPETIATTAHGIQTIENIHNLTAQIQALHKLMQKAAGNTYDPQTQSTFATELVKVFNKVRTMQTYTSQLLVGASQTALLNREQQNYVKNFMIPGLEFKPQIETTQQPTNNQTIPLSTPQTGNVIPTAIAPTTSTPTTETIPLETAKKKKKKRKKRKKGKKKKKKRKTHKGKKRKKKKGTKKKAKGTKKKKRKKNKKKKNKKKVQ